MTLRPILEVRNKDMDYKGGGRRREPWLWQMADWKQLSATLEEILAAARAWCWES